MEFHLRIPSPRGSFFAVFSVRWMKPEVTYTFLWLSPFRFFLCAKKLETSTCRGLPSANGKEDRTGQRSQTNFRLWVGQRACGTDRAAGERSITRSAPVVSAGLTSECAVGWQKTEGCRMGPLARPPRQFSPTRPLVFQEASLSFFP